MKPIETIEHNGVKLDVFKFNSKSNNCNQCYFYINHACSAIGSSIDCSGVNFKLHEEPMKNETGLTFQNSHELWFYLCMSGTIADQEGNLYQFNANGELTIKTPRSTDFCRAITGLTVFDHSHYKKHIENSEETMSEIAEQENDLSTQQKRWEYLFSGGILESPNGIILRVKNGRLQHKSYVGLFSEEWKSSQFTLIENDYKKHIHQKWYEGDQIRNQGVLMREKLTGHLTVVRKDHLFCAENFEPATKEEALELIALSASLER